MRGAANGRLLERLAESQLYIKPNTYLLAATFYTYIYVCNVVLHYVFVGTISEYLGMKYIFAFVYRAAQCNTLWSDFEMLT